MPIKMAELMGEAGTITPLQSTYGNREMQLVAGPNICSSRVMTACIHDHTGEGDKKPRENRKTLPVEHLSSCQFVKLFLGKA